jgi:phosphoribosylanthranilate isomerase
MVKIKNCGISTAETLRCAVTHGASFIGFVFHPASPRHLNDVQIARLGVQMPDSVKLVMVLVNPSDALLASLPRPDFWQIHGVDDPARIHAIHQQTGIPVISAIRVRTVSDIANAYRLEEVSAHLLFDAYHHEQAGGAGVAFDWTLLSGISLAKPWFLAGGLTAENVAEALRITRAPMVDVSSGIETAPGIKSEEKIAAFNQAVLSH